MTRSAVAVSGALGYLGSAVMAELNGCLHTAVPGRLEQLRPGSLDCRAVVHCAGRLRGHPDAQIWRDNVTATAALLGAIPASAAFLLASSRAVTSSAPDLYGRSKRRAEQLAAAHPGPVCVARLTVLAGPSPAGLGCSFLARMARSAVLRGVITVPRHARPVDLLDVREAAAVLAAAARSPAGHATTVHGTIGPLDLFDLAEFMAETAGSVTGKPIMLSYGIVPDSQHPSPEDPAGWRVLRNRYGIAPIAWRTTAADLVSACLTGIESGRARG